MEPVAKLAVLHVADKAVDPRDRLADILGSIEPQILCQTKGFGLGANVVLQPVAAARVEPVGIGKLVEQRLEPDHAAGRATLHQGWRHMAEGDRADAPFRLHRLARIVDDERVDHRQPGEQRLGPAVLGQGHGFARQPFERAMGADVNERVGLILQPEVKGHVAMARHPFEIVIFVVALGELAAFGL